MLDILSNLAEIDEGMQLQPRTFASSSSKQLRIPVLRMRT
jgi:hypothetical protein